MTDKAENCPEEYSQKEWLWIKPLKKILKDNGVKCGKGSLALMCEINNHYRAELEAVRKELADHKANHNTAKWGETLNKRMDQITGLEKELEELKKDIKHFTSSLVREELLKLEKENASLSHLVGEMRKALESIQGCWNGESENAVYAVKEMRFRAKKGISLDLPSSLKIVGAMEKVCEAVRKVDFVGVDGNVASLVGELYELKALREAREV